MNRRTQRGGWGLMAVLVVLGVIVALGGMLMSSMVRQRREMRYRLEVQQARWLAASVVRMTSGEVEESSRATWKPSLAVNSPIAELRARIEVDRSNANLGERRVVVETSENGKSRIVYSELLVGPSK